MSAARLSTQLRVRLPVDLRRDLERLAQIQDLALSDYVRRALHKAAGEDMQRRFDEAHNRKRETPS